MTAGVVGSSAWLADFVSVDSLAFMVRNSGKPLSRRNPSLGSDFTFQTRDNRGVLSAGTPVTFEADLRRDARFRMTSGLIQRRLLPLGIPATLPNRTRSLRLSTPLDSRSAAHTRDLILNREQSIDGAITILRIAG